jgi:hypothetical protein
VKEAWAKYSGDESIAADLGFEEPRDTYVPDEPIIEDLDDNYD